VRERERIREHTGGIHSKVTEQECNLKGVRFSLVLLPSLLFDFRCRKKSEDFELISEMFPSSLSPSVNIEDNGTSTLNKTSQSQHKRILLLLSLFLLIHYSHSLSLTLSPYSTFSKASFGFSPDFWLRFLFLSEDYPRSNEFTMVFKKYI